MTLCPSIRNRSSRNLSLSRLVAEAGEPPCCISACDKATTAEAAGEGAGQPAAGAPPPAAPDARKAPQHHAAACTAAEDGKDEVWHDCVEGEDRPATDSPPDPGVQCSKPQLSVDTASCQCCSIM